MTSETSRRLRPPTAADVAAAAGVSRTTVSHILNGRGDRFPTATRDRVLSAARSLDYHPSPAGRNLVNGRSDMVVVVAPNTTWGPNLQDAVEQVSKDVEPFGGSAFVRFVGAQEVASAVTSILTLRPLAVVDLGVLGTADRQRLADHGVLTVPQGTPEGDTGGLDRKIASLQLQELLRSGKRTIFFGALSDTRLDQYGPGRFTQLTDLCRLEGIAAPTWVDVPLDTSQAIDAVSAHVGREAVGFACYNDDVALAVLAVGQRLNLSVPTNLAVVGVDHTPVGQLWNPPLTTVDVNVRAIMDAAIQNLQVLTNRQAGEATHTNRELARLVGGKTT